MEIKYMKDKSIKIKHMGLVESYMKMELFMLESGKMDYIMV